MLAQYVTEVQDHMNDCGGEFFRLPTLHRYINRARRRVAASSGVLRVLPFGTVTRPFQEIYEFSEWTSLVQDQMPGVQGVLFCRSLSVAIGGRWDLDGKIRGGTWKMMWQRLAFTDFQARFRVYSGTFVGTISYPGWYAQLGSGPNGKIYLFPIPTQQNPMEVDLTCIPSDLITDDDPEPLPYPWTDAVSYWTAVLCLLQQQRRESAQAMAQLFNSDLPMCASVVCPQFLTSPYVSGIMRSA
jgi:hypothetical protein